MDIAKKSWNSMDEFSSEPPRNMAKSQTLNLVLLAPTQHFHRVLTWLELLMYIDVCSGIFVYGKFLRCGRFSFTRQYNMQKHSTDAKLSPLNAAYHSEIASSVEAPSILLLRT